MGNFVTRVEEEIKTGYDRTTATAIDFEKHHLDIESKKWRSRELAIWAAETRIWNRLYDECIFGEEDRSSLLDKCSVLHTITGERSAYSNSQFHPFMRPRLTPGLPFEKTGHEEFEYETNLKILNSMAKDGITDLENAQEEYDRRRQQMILEYRLKYCPEDVKSRFPDLNKDTLKRLEEANKKAEEKRSRLARDSMKQQGYDQYTAPKNEEFSFQ